MTVPLAIPGAALRASRILAAAFLGATALRAESWYRSTFQGPVTASTFETQTPRGVLRVGPVIIDVSAQASFEASDNALLSSQPESGSSLTFGGTFDAVWQAAKVQQLKITGEAMQRLILSGPGRDLTYFTLAPGSALRYTMYVSDVRVMPFLNVSRQIDPIAEPTVSNTDIFEQATYDAGVQVDVPMGQYTAQFMVLRGLRTADSDQQARLEADRMVISGRLLRVFSPAYDGGIDLFVVNQTLENGSSDSSQTVSASVFGRATLSRAIKLKLALGVTQASYERSLSELDDDETVEFYGDAELSHRVRQNLNYTLRLAQGIGEGVTSNFYRSTEVNFNPSMVLSQRLTLHGEGGWQRIVESLENGEVGIRWNYGVRAEYTLAGNLTLRGGFREIDKTSSAPGRAYTQRRIDLQAKKQF